MSLGALVLVGCKKEQPEPVELSNAVISGRVTADLDLSNDVNATGVYQEGLNPEAVEGVQVRVEVNTANWDVGTTGGYTYPTKVYTATTDANGNYTLNIPVHPSKPFNANVEFGRVLRTQTMYEPNATTPLTREVEFGFNSINVEVFAGANLGSNHTDGYIYDIVDGGGVTEDLGKYTLSGTVYLNNDTSNDTLPNGNYEIQYEAIPAGTKITAVYDNTYSDYIPGIGNYGQGELTIEIPINPDGTYSVELPTGGNIGDNHRVRFYFPELLLQRKFFSGPYPGTDTEDRVYTIGSQLVYIDNGGIEIERNFWYN